MELEIVAGRNPQKESRQEHGEGRQHDNENWSPDEWTTGITIWRLCCLQGAGQTFRRQISLLSE